MVQRILQRDQPFFADPPKTAQHRIIMPQRQEEGRCALVVRGRATRRQVAQAPRFIDDTGGRNHEAEPDTRGENFRQAGDIDYAAVLIEAAKGGQGVSEIVHLALKIILQNEEVALGSHGKQRLAPTHRHGNAGRALPTGRNIDDIIAWQTVIDDQALIVDRLVVQLRPMHREHLAQIGQAGLFQRDTRSGVGE